MLIQEEHVPINAEDMCSKCSTGDLPLGGFPKNSMVRIFDGSDLN